MDSTLTLFQYVDAAADSSKRGRLVLLVLVVASVVAFSAAWNASPNGWINKRYEVEHDALTWWNEIKLHREPPESLTAARRERFQQASAYVASRILRNDTTGFSTLVDEASQTRRVRVEDVNLVRIPFFGVYFDVNDLSLLAGFGFSVILLWFYFSVSSELRDLRFAFNFAARPDVNLRDLCYELLATRQVLTIPPKTTFSSAPLFKLLIHLLFLLPTLVQAAIVVQDSRTTDLAFSVSPQATWIAVVGGRLFLAVIVLLTIGGTQVSHQIGKEWKIRSDAYSVGQHDVAPTYPNTSSNRPTSR